MEQKIDKLTKLVAKVLEETHMTNQRLDRVEQRLGSMEQRLDNIEKSLDYQKHLVSTHDEKLYHLTKENKN